MTIRKEQIGDATLYCGDCLEVMAEIGEYQTVVTDPPYGMSFRSNHRATKHSEIANDGNIGMLQWACELPADHSKYVFCRWDNLLEVPEPKSLVTWVKNNWSMGDLNHEHGRQTEVILFYPGARHFFPNVRPSDVVDARRTGNPDHPTEKPVGLMEVVVLWTYGAVLDPFMGAGSTGAACIRLGRPFIGIELDGGYFDKACRRLEAALGEPGLFRPRASNDNMGEQVPMFSEAS